MGRFLACGSALLNGRCARRVSSGKAAGHSDGLFAVDSGGSLCFSRVGDSSSARLRPKVLLIADGKSSFFLKTPARVKAGIAELNLNPDETITI